ncbi:MAG: hypothetical protein ACFCVE_06155 [Phycisphaerae bacterium]
MHHADTHLGERLVTAARIAAAEHVRQELALLAAQSRPVHRQLDEPNSVTATAEPVELSENHNPTGKRAA